MSTEGSDCKTGKRQFASKEAADANVRWNYATNGWTSLRSYRCDMCKCWHTGNRIPKPPPRKGRRK